MPQFQPRSFAYAHSKAVIRGLMAHANSRKHYIGEDYAYIEKPGETVMFQAMLEVAEQGGNDILYVDTVKELAGNSLSEFKANLAAIEKAKMKIISLSEPHYDYNDFQTVIQVLEDLTPGYRKDYQRTLAVMLNDLGIVIRDIMEQTALSESDVYLAISEYKREQEQRREQEREQEDER